MKLVQINYKLPLKLVQINYKLPLNLVQTYLLQLKSGITLPFFGEVIPQIAMTYNIASHEKAVRVNLTDTNALRYVITDNSYTFGIKYGVEQLSRSALCQL